jgi:hypothetical protein
LQAKTFPVVHPGSAYLHTRTAMMMMMMMMMMMTPKSSPSGSTPAELKDGAA